MVEAGAGGLGVLTKAQTRDQQLFSCDSASCVASLSEECRSGRDRLIRSPQLCFVAAIIVKKEMWNS